MKTNVGRMTRGGGTAQINAEKRGLTQKEKIKRGTERQKKRGKTLLTSTGGQREKEVTTSLFRIQEGCLVGSFHLLNVLPLVFVQWFSAQTPEPCWLPGTVKPVFKDLGWKHSSLPIYWKAKSWIIWFKAEMWNLFVSVKPWNQSILIQSLCIWLFTRVLNMVSSCVLHQPAMIDLLEKP